MADTRGYLFIDFGASPGIPEDMARMAGLDGLGLKEGKRTEVGTLTCAHCKTVVVPNPKRVLERSKCSKCGWHYICDVCAFRASQPDYDHTPYEKRVELVIAGKPDPMGTPVKLIMP